MVMFTCSSHVSWLKHTEVKIKWNTWTAVLWSRSIGLRLTLAHWHPRWICRIRRQWCPAQREGWGAEYKHPARQNTTQSALQSTSCQHRGSRSTCILDSWDESSIYIILHIIYSLSCQICKMFCFLLAEYNKMKQLLDLNHLLITH